MTKNIVRRRIFSFHLMGVTILIVSLLFSIFVYPWVFERSIEMFINLFECLKFYFFTLFGIDSVPPAGIGMVSGVDHSVAFPIDWESFKLKFVEFWQQFFNGDNFLNWTVDFSSVMLIALTIIQLFIIFGVLIRLILSLYLESKNNNYGEDTKSLKRFKKFEKFLEPIKNWVVRFKVFFRECKFPYKKIFIAIWLYNFNIYTIIGETLAYLFYLVCYLDFSNFYTQIYKLVFDISLMFKALPWYIWLYLFVCFVRKWRIKRALKKLAYMLAQNCDFINSLSLASLFTGPMNFGKTKALTSMSLTQVMLFKESAKDTLFKIDFKFPYFPFVKFERCLRSAIKSRRVYNLATCETFVRQRRRMFEFGSKYGFGKDYLFDYDYNEFGLTYNNGMYLENLFDCLETYAKAYFIYTLDCSLIVSNYAIREDNVLETLDNFPIWDFEFFERDPNKLDDISYYSKILDFDVLRKGRKVIPSNELSDTLEFGVVSITELDKERGNSQDTKELKKMVEVANQKNDLFNYSLKMGRHPSTIDFKPYIKFFFDLQRSMKVDADLREVCGEVLDITGTQERELAMPWFFVEEFLYGLLIPKFKDTYEMYRFYHGNNTLFMYLLRKFCIPLHNHYLNIYNKFGYDICFFNMQNGKLDDVGVEKKYYIMYKKDFANRYSTDSHADFYRQASLKKSKGLADYQAYKSSRASLEELKLQNSYFIRDIDNAFSDDCSEDKK